MHASHRDCATEQLLGCAYARMQAAVQSRQDVPDRLGSVVLRKHQRQAINVLRQMMSRFGGALLADDVGTGKTFCALGVAAQYERVLIVAPAALRDRWRDAAEQAEQQIDFVSFQALSLDRGAFPAKSFDLIIVDEAHHARTRTTRRYAALATLAVRTPVLLLSATPLHNRVEDLHALLALFLGSGVRRLALADCAPLILRRQDLQELELPVATPIRWHTVAADPHILDALLTLPPPINAADEGSAAALGRFMLLRQWCSSEAALAASLDRMRRRALVMQTGIARGQVPTKRELLMGLASSEDTQLTLDFSHPDEQLAVQELGLALREHLRAVAAALEVARRALPGAGQRWESVARILNDHPGCRAVLFSHSIDTARHCFNTLKHAVRVACLDGDGARIASGRLRGREVIASFQPRARQIRSMPIDVLIATDVLSEGIDLHAANILIHLDLPWTAARMEQRLGRLCRIGSPHDTVFQHALSPPAAGNGIVRILERLAMKARLTHEHIRNDPIFFNHSATVTERQVRTSDLLSRITSRLDTLAAGCTPRTRCAPSTINQALHRATAGNSEPIVATSLVPPGAEDSFLFALNDGRLAAGTGARISTSPVDVAAMLERATCREAPADPSQIQQVRSAVQRWLQVTDIVPSTDALSVAPSDAHKQIEEIIEQHLSSAPRQLRADVATWGQRVRTLLASIRGAGAENVLGSILEWWKANGPTARNTARSGDELLEKLSPLTRDVPSAAGASVVAVVILSDSVHPG